MSDLCHAPDIAETRARWGASDWNAINRDCAAKSVARYGVRCYIRREGASA
jgi:hypothetical protein